MRYVKIFLLVVGFAAAVMYFFFQRDQNAARQRVAAGSRTVETPCGPIEYSEAGAGEPVLVIHGAGGGYDQGLLLGQIILGQDLRLIAPSRFGYLNTPIPADSSLETQADAYACLLDALGVEQVHVVAISAGGPSGLAFAMRHPDRTLDLVMLSAVSYTEPRSGASRINMESSLNRVIGSDFTYWVFYRFFPGEFLSLVGVPKSVQQSISAQAQAAAHQLLDWMQPMSMRFPGILLDQSRELPKDRQIDIQVPTLVIHAKDDTLVPVSMGEFTAEKVPGAKLMLFDTGGHFLLGKEAQVRPAIRDYWKNQLAAQ